MQDNLSYRIHDAMFNNGASHLTDSEQASLLETIGKRCRADTKERLAHYISRPLVHWPDYGIYRRVTFVNGQVDYICGQSWSDEMRTLRKCILSK